MNDSYETMMHARVERTGRCNTILKVLSALLGAWLLGSCLFGFQQTATQRVVEAGGFHLIDNQDRTRAILGMAGNDPELVILDTKGKVAARLALSGDAIGVTFNKGKATISLELIDQAARLKLDAGDEGTSVLIEASKSGSTLAFQDIKAVKRLEMRTNPSGQSSIRMRDADGHDRAVWEIRDDHPALEFVGADGKIIWSALAPRDPKSSTQPEKPNSGQSPILR